MKKYILLIFISMVSCGSFSEKKKITLVKERIGLKSKDVIINDFDLYWKVLGEAVVKNDTIKLKSMVKYPLQVLGREDKDPHLMIGESQIVNVLSYAFEKGGYYDDITDQSYSNKELILKDLTDLREYKSNSDSQWINDFVFNKTSDGWKLVILYINTVDYLKKNW